jgi:hypothetical protein
VTTKTIKTLKHNFLLSVLDPDPREANTTGAGHWSRGILKVTSKNNRSTTVLILKK